METLSQMYARHDRELKNLMEDQQVSWNALNEKYGKGNIPADAYKQWDQQHGNTRLHGLRAQQEAEIEAYPLNPMAYRYQQEGEKQAAAEQTEPPSHEQKQPAPLRKYFNPVTGREMTADAYEELQSRIDQQRQREIERQNQQRPGHTHSR